MEQIGFVYGELFVRWEAVLTTMGVALAVCIFLWLYLRKTGDMIAAAVTVPLAMVLSLFFGRLVCWYCRVDGYESLMAALADFRSGSFALMGAFAGCFLAAVLLRLLGISGSLPEMLDCMALAGSAGISIGRLACFFNSADRGMLMEESLGLPWVYPVKNAVSGVREYRLATFLLQAMTAGVLFFVLLGICLAGQKRKTLKNGDTFLLFLLCYGASQILLDSTRYDSLYFRSNGFVSIVQVLGAMAIGLVILCFSARLVRSRGWRGWYLVLWLLCAALLGLGGYMEYHVQRYGNQAAFAYGAMGGCLLGLIAVALLIRCLAKQRGTPLYGQLARQDAVN